ncbi:hypothetical protein ISR92_02865 [Patescibacteria group bacterium]|nr:hypothetical protein [Patescibacteria group bacterium]
MENRDDELKFLLLKLQALRDVVKAKSKIIPTVASLSATVLIVATFNNELLPLTHGLKVVLSILLGLIPISVILYLIELEVATKSEVKSIEDQLGKKIVLDEGWSCFKKVLNHLLFLIPYLGSAILLLCIVYIIVQIWI